MSFGLTNGNLLCSFYTVIRSIWRTPEKDLADLLRDIALVCVADALVGVSFGAIAVGLGLPLWLPMLMSVVVFAGAAQFLFIGIVGAAAIRWPRSRRACWSTCGTCRSVSRSGTCSPAPDGCAGSRAAM